MGIENVEKAERKTCVALNNENHFQKQGGTFSKLDFNCFIHAFEHGRCSIFVPIYKYQRIKQQKNLKRMNYKEYVE